LTGKTRSPFNRTCKKLGIKQLFTSAYDSSQNGKAERSNRTIVEGMRVALIDSHFDWTWWPEAAKYAAFTTNRLRRNVPKRRRPQPEGAGREDQAANSGNSLSSAYTRLTGLKSNTQDLVAFGQRGEHELPKPKKRKDAMVRTTGVRLIGYPDDTKGYIVVDKKGTRLLTDKVKFSYARQPIQNNIKRSDDKMVEKLMYPDPRRVDDDISTPIEGGTARGMDDGDLRKSADRCDNEVIKFKAPIHHHTTPVNRMSRSTSFGMRRSPAACRRRRQRELSPRS
jgi:hypothetical protein